MRIEDIRLLDKKIKSDLANNYSAEFAYVLSKKIKQPIYCAKRVKSVKYFVEYFNVIEDDMSFNLVDINRVVTPKNKKGYDKVVLKLDDLDKNKVNFLEKQLKNSFKLVFQKKVDDLTYTYLENEFYQTDIPFRRDVLIVKKGDELIATCYVTGYLFNKHEVRDIEEDCLNKLIDINSDCKKVKNKFDCVYALMEDYLSDRYSKNFIDSVIVKKEYRSLGIATKVYEIIFEHFNRKEINITSCKNDIQSDDAIGLWDKIKGMHPDRFKSYNNYNFLDYRC